MQTTTLKTKEMRQAVTAAVQERLLRVQQVGLTNAWCKDCSEMDLAVLAKCGCKYQRFFGCVGYSLCPACREAHRAAEKFIAQMFTFPICERSDSRRAARYSTLCRAAAVVAGEKHDLTRGLHDANPFHGPDAEFRERILGSFRDSDFRQFKQLATELEKQKESEFTNAVYRAVRRAMSGGADDDD